MMDQCCKIFNSQSKKCITSVPFTLNHIRSKNVTLLETINVQKPDSLCPSYLLVAHCCILYSPDSPQPQYGRVVSYIIRCSAVDLVFWIKHNLFKYVSISPHNTYIILKKRGINIV